MINKLNVFHRLAKVLKVEMVDIQKHTTCVIDSGKIYL